MKKVILALLLLCVGYWSALNQAKLKSWLQGMGLRVSAANENTGPETATPGEGDDSPSLHADTAPLVKAPAPSATGTSTPPVPPPTPSNQSSGEDDIYYTKERISQMVDQGVVVIPEGSEVRVVGELNGQLIIEADGKRVLTSRRKLTRDSAEVQGSSPQGNAIAANAVGKDTPKPPSSSSADAKKIRDANSLKRQVISAKIAELESRMFAANRQILNMRAQSQLAQVNGRPSTYNDRPIAALQAQISAMEAERSKLRIEQAGIPR
jgi:hypothetical protein